MSTALAIYPVDHAGRRTVMHPDLHREIPAQTAVRYLRFLQPARVDYLELPVMSAGPNSGRWVPSVPTHPAHVLVSVLEPRENRWRVVKAVDLPLNPRFAGEGLTQSVPIEAMETFFRNAVAAQAAHRIELGGIETTCLKVECDREHRVWPNHGECNGGPFNVPFGILAGLGAFGAGLAAPAAPAYQRKLTPGPILPVAPAQMTVSTRNPCEIIFQGEQLTVGFSLVRPRLTRLSWDTFGEGGAALNRLCFRHPPDSLGGLNGPSYITPAGNAVAQNLSGSVAVAGNRVLYRDLDSGCGVVVNAVFTVTAEALTLELEQRADHDLPVLEGEAWRLLWDMRSGLTGVAAVPTNTEGRNGFVNLPAFIAADAGGCLAVRLLDGEGAFHTESYHNDGLRSTAFVLGRTAGTETPQIVPAGVSRAVFSLQPTALLPVPAAATAALSPGLRRCWTAGFSAFRPEFGGFSNNAISVNCHVNQHTAFDVAAFTAKPVDGPDPLELVMFSVGRALLDGGGYGYHRCLYLDSDPILLSGAGRVFQLGGDRRWLERVRPGITAAAQRILGNFDAREGMVVCQALSGNSGSHRWSSNAMDVVGFGHIDAYVNAWSFRALKNAVGLCCVLGEPALAARCAEVAAALAENYGRQLLNPETGWVAGWRSRDGQLHDYGFLWINGVACAFGVMGLAQTTQALAALEARRAAVFPESGYLGLPLNLLPIATADHMLGKMRGPLMPTFETYTDGALSPCMAGYYLRALSAYGFRREAAGLADRLEHGFEDGGFHGGYGTGKEFTTWSGADSGYEGTFGPNSGPLYALAVERGAIRAPQPEWWFAE